MSGRDFGARAGWLRVLSRLLIRRDWAYVLALVVPFVGINLALKVSSAASLGRGGAGAVGFLASDLLFCVGYALLWVVLFAAFRGGRARSCVVALFHASAVLLALLTVAAYRFFGVTGSRLDLDTVLYFLSSPREVMPVGASEASPAFLVAAAAALLYALLGPRLLAGAVGRGPSPNPSPGQNPRPTWHAPAVAGRGPASSSRSPRCWAPPPGLRTRCSPGAPRSSWSRRRSNTWAPHGSASTPPGTEKRNVVVISLESTRARSVTPYNGDLSTTPFLDGLARRSVFAERAYAVTPHTTNALTATLCDVDLPDRAETDSLGDRIPSRCLPDLLAEQGYRTAFFQAVKEDFERRLGYEDFYSVEDMDTGGFERANYFGYEDDVMLGPSKEWLGQNGDGPFLASRPWACAYNTITPHHQYLAPSGRYGREEFAEDDTLNRYQNSVRYLDFFVENLIGQYKEMGLYEDTIFVIVGDHGEGFGEHGRYQHDNVIWEEGIRIPLMVLDPARPSGGRGRDPANQLDVLPTVADLLGYGIEGWEYPGRSMLGPPPAGRTLRFACWYENSCVASLEDGKKYVYHYGNRPEELYDLSQDPREKENIASEVPPEYLEVRREDLLGWRATVGEAYDDEEGPAS